MATTGDDYAVEQRLRDDLIAAGLRGWWLVRYHNEVDDGFVYSMIREGDWKTKVSAPRDTPYDEVRNLIIVTAKTLCL